MNFGLDKLIASIKAFIAKTDQRVLIGGAVGVLALAGGLSYWLIRGADSTDTAEIIDASCVPLTNVTVTDDDYVIGDKNAPVTLVEYLSQTCSHCAEFRRDEIPKIEEAYVKTGKLRIVFREMHRNNIDVAASVLGRCLGRDAFLPFTDMLLEQQSVWMMRDDQDVIAGLKEMARRAGMSSGDFDECLKKQDLATSLAKASNKAAKDYCITGTPTLLLNGKKIEGLGISHEKLDASIREELKKAGVSVPEPKTETPASETAAPADGATAPPADGAAATPEGAAAEPASPPATDAPGK